MAALQDGPKKGQVLAVGGSDDYPGAELFNPATSTWSPTTDMAQPSRYYLGAIPLADGRVIVAGGNSHDPNTPLLDGVEIFDAENSWSWSQINSMNLKRYSSVSVELLDGRILIAGGVTDDGIGGQVRTNTAETYLPCPSNLAPIAACIPDRTINTSTIPANACSITVGNVDNGSSDPDNQPWPLDVSQAPAVGTVVNGTGTTTVTLIASDGSRASSCTTKITLVDNTPPVVACRDDDPNLPGNQVYLECVNGGASGTFTAQATDNCGGSTTATCTPSSAWLPLGSNTPVTCRATDGSGNQGSCNTQAIVRDTQPPVPGASVGMVLWPPDSLLQGAPLTACVGHLVDACRGKLLPIQDHVVISHVTSDEPENANGGSDGNTTGDIQIQKPWKALLRAERNSSGNGRVYTIYYVGKDPSGNTTPIVSCKVSVPKTQGGTAIEDPPVPGVPVYCIDNPDVPGNPCP
jgi:hypothetical protein